MRSFLDNPERRSLVLSTASEPGSGVEAAAGPGFFSFAVVAVGTGLTWPVAANASAPASRTIRESTNRFVIKCNDSVIRFAGAFTHGLPARLRDSQHVHKGDVFAVLYQTESSTGEFRESKESGES